MLILKSLKCSKARNPIRVEHPKASVARAEGKVIVRVLSPPCVDLADVGGCVMKSMFARWLLSALNTGKDGYPLGR